MSFIEFLSSIPAIIGSAIIASCITLLGVIVSNRSNTHRLIQQLAHDSDEKSKERISLLRRDVYMKAVEEMVRAGAYLGAIPQIDPTKTNAGEGLTNFFAAVSKIQLIAESKTASIASDFTAKFATAHFALLAEAAPIQELNSKIQRLDEYYSIHQSEVSRIESELKELNESGQFKEHRNKELRLSLEASLEALRKYAESRNQAAAQHVTLSKLYTMKIMHEMRDVTDVQTSLKAALRRELNLDQDSPDVLERSAEHRRRVNNAAQSFLEDL